MLAHETGVADAVDPLAGSAHVEALTDAIEAEARRWFDEIEARGGAVAAIEAGFLQDAIEEAAYAFQRDVEAGRRVVVGVNRFQDETPLEVPVQAIDPRLEPARADDLRRFREARDGAAASDAVARLVAAATAPDAPLMPAVRGAFAARATLGEVCGALRGVWGEHRG